VSIIPGRSVKLSIQPEQYLFTFTAVSMIIVGAAAFVSVLRAVERARASIGVRFWCFHADVGLWLTAFGMAMPECREADSY
jgi:hypothetical protein